MIKKEKSEKLGRVPTEMELILEHTQQGISHEVSVSTEGVEELKRNDKIKGVKKEALLIHLGRNRVNSYAIKNTKVLFGIEDQYHVTQLVILQRVLRIILVILPEHPSDAYVFTMKMEILLESTSNKLMVGHKNYFVSDLLIDFQIKFSLSIGEIVTHWFTLIVLSALRRSGNENMLTLVILILRSILTDLQEWRYLFPAEQQFITICSYPTIKTSATLMYSNRKEVVPMADRTMEELLKAPTEGYGEAIVILEILAENFEIKTNLLQVDYQLGSLGLGNMMWERDRAHGRVYGNDCVQCKCRN
nr:reverse transcriptase domain-containing protein [Tanacetum cinerariifolium]